MQSHEVLKAAFDKSSPKAIAADLGVSLSLVYKWAQDQSDIGSGSRNPLDRIMEVYRHTNHIEIIEWLCEQSGGFYVKNPVAEKHEAFDLFPATNSILHQFSDLLSQITDAAADHTITKDEAAEIRSCWDKLKGIAEGFVKCCEDGNYLQTETAPTIEAASPSPASDAPRTRLY